MLYKVWRRNDVFELGAIYRKFDDGMEKCIMETVNGRQKIIGYSGIVIPTEAIAPYLIAIKKNGFDYNALAERQKGN